MVRAYCKVVGLIHIIYLQESLYSLSVIPFFLDVQLFALSEYTLPCEL